MGLNITSPASASATAAKNSAERFKALPKDLLYKYIPRKYQLSCTYKSSTADNSLIPSKLLVAAVEREDELALRTYVLGLNVTNFCAGMTCRFMKYFSADFFFARLVDFLYTFLRHF